MTPSWRLAAVLACAGCGTDPEISLGKPGSEFFVAGTHGFPEVRMLRGEILDDDGTPLGINSFAATVVVLPGYSTCAFIGAPLCQPTSCRLDLSFANPGLCMVQIRVSSLTGDDLATCWYRGLHEVGSLDDQATIDRLGDDDVRAWEDCKATL